MVGNEAWIARVKVWIERDFHNLSSTEPKKPGFLPFLRAVTRLISEKPGFWPPARPGLFYTNEVSAERD